MEKARKHISISSLSHTLFPLFPCVFFLPILLSLTIDNTSYREHKCYTDPKSVGKQL